MSISDTVSQVVATNPIVGVAVSTQSIKSAILAGLQSGDSATASLLGAVSSQAQTANQLLSSLSSLGQNVDLRG